MCAKNSQYCSIKAGKGPVQVAESKNMRIPTFVYERKLWKKGYRHIGGIDEVGRGCFAGPVVAGCVVFGEKGVRGIGGVREVRVNDSKKLSEKQREVASEWIKENALSWGVGEVSASTINRVGIVKATEIAFRKAIKMANERLERRKVMAIRGVGDVRGAEAQRKIDFLLIDAFYIPYVKDLRRRNQKAIVKGDAKSISIAAASIIAKVYRDNVMQKLGSRQRYKRYGWIQNKGYGTKIHLEAIQKYGINGYHRKQFVSTYLLKNS